MEQLLLSGKDGWRVPRRRPGTSVGEEGYGWLGPLPTFTSICYSCPNSFTSTNAIFQALKPPTQPAGHSFGQLAHVAPMGREAAALTHFTLLEADWSSRRTLKGQSQPS